MAEPTELAQLRGRIDALEQRERQQLDLIRSLATQLNRNTVMMKRWLDSTPELQTIERDHAQALADSKSALILPARHDASVIPINRLHRR